MLTSSKSQHSLVLHGLACGRAFAVNPPALAFWMKVNPIHLQNPWTDAIRNIVPHGAIETDGIWSPGFEWKCQEERSIWAQLGSSSHFGNFISGWKIGVGDWGRAFAKKEVFNGVGQTYFHEIYSDVSWSSTDLFSLGAWCSFMDSFSRILTGFSRTIMNVDGFSQIFQSWIKLRELSMQDFIPTDVELRIDCHQSGCQRHPSFWVA